MEKAEFRQQVLLKHLNTSQTSSSADLLDFQLCSSSSIPLTHNGASVDVVIVAACRTPICKANRGSFKDTHADDLLQHVLKAVLDKTGTNPHEIGDIVVGNVLAPGFSRGAECRMSAFYAGFPDTVPIKTVNRQCASGLQAVADVAAAIKSGFYDIGIAAGVESMSLDRGIHKHTFNPQVKIRPNQNAKDCLIPMGITSDTVAEQYGVSRLDQDKAALSSHKNAAKAAASGKFDDEIVPVQTNVIDNKNGTIKSLIVSVDDGIRPDSSLSVLAKLKPAFKSDGTTTAGNSSQVSDGAAAILLMRKEVALQRCLPILGIFRYCKATHVFMVYELGSDLTGSSWAKPPKEIIPRWNRCDQWMYLNLEGTMSFSAVGVKPAVMGIGPAFAIPTAVDAAKLKLNDIDLFEINEAFASQYVYCVRKLCLNAEKVNVNGGAIALGHPVGATGARCVATLLHEMKRRGTSCRYGVVSMCMGSGMGGAAVFESM